MEIKKLEDLGFTRAEILRALLDEATRNPHAPRDATVNPWAEWIGRVAIVRGYGSGVHAGVVTAVHPSTDGRLAVTLAEGNVRLWLWDVSHCNGRTLSALAAHGLCREKSKTEACKTVVLIPDCCELIEVAPAVAAGLLEATWR